MSTFQVFVKSLDGKTYAIEINPSTTTADIRNKIFDRTGIKPEEMVLNFGGKPI